MSKFQKGHKINLGKKHSKETKQKIRLATFIQFKKGMPLETKRKMKIAKLGSHRSKETKIKISNSLKGIKKKPMSEKTKEKLSNLNKGEKSHLWKGGITEKNLKIRNSIEMRLWREDVFERDNWTCQKTKIKGGKLCSHHIQNFAEFPELRFEVDNGITLSEKSHKEFHKIYGVKNNTRKQLNEFLKDKRL